ncbi:ABC transporter ATP-binding protein [Fictibacillus nanhaiensis]|uniref:ABC transporter ATP-binding protein n=1 Tax=Fictibacillus nanhaiensis TaxID=742169 RepID=UPI001C94D67B|nr:ABC transporter ATP-binding protein [Fictibacillus nanhaiensis]MBY6038409.1 ABC transporter ATP-binding protein [Fictibacillus nanhaiensis]
MPLLTISNLSINHVDSKIVDNVNLELQAGEWHALVGESGSGKSVTAFSIGRLLPSELEVQSGSIKFKGTELTSLAEKELRKKRAKEIAYIFQDYQGALTPFMKIGKQFDELLYTHTDWTKSERKEKISQILHRVGLQAERTLNSYPFQLSGGQVQRAVIAMSAILEPKLLIADEPTTALDSLTSGTVLDLIQDLQKQTNCAVLFITHDLRLVKKYGETVSVMKHGRIVEHGSKKEIFESPEHPYTKQLLASVPPLRNVPHRLNTGYKKEEAI